MFVIHRGSLREFLPVAEHVARVVGEGAAVHVGDVGAGQAHPQDDERQGPALSSRAAATRPANSFRTSRGSALFARLRAKVNPGARTRIETTLNYIFAAVLEGGHVGRNDNLFAIGATSLSLIQIHESYDWQDSRNGRAIRFYSNSRRSPGSPSILNEGSARPD